MDIKLLQEQINNFASERDWEKFHTPKNISMALNVEASELLEIFQWLTPEESFEIIKNKTKKVAIEDEVADILVYLLRLSQLLNLDIETIIQSKIKKNAEKYPIEKSKGNCKKYTEL